MFKSYRGVVWTLGLVLAAVATGFWPQQAQAFTFSCGITVSGTQPNPQTVNASSAATFAVQVTDVNSGCGGTGNVSFSIDSPPGDGTGGLVLASPMGVAVGTDSTTEQDFTVTAGPNGGGTVIIRATLTNCVGGAPCSAVYTLNTANVFTFTATTPTTHTIAQSGGSANLGISLLLNGTPSTLNYQFFNVTNSTVQASGALAAGLANTSFNSFIAGTYNIQGQIVCPTLFVLQGCPPPPVPFTVVVEPTNLTAITGNTATITSGGNVTFIARYGGPTTVTPVGDVVSWNITGSPGGGDGVVSGVTTTNAGGQSQATFTATVAGVYTLTASTGDTFSADSTETFTITVNAITETLVISGGNTQITPTGQAFALPLQVLAEDNAAPVPGIPVNWAVVSGNASLSAATTLTNAAGVAAVSVTALPGPANTIVISGTRADPDDDGNIETVSFTLNATLTPTLVIVSGNSQAAVPGAVLPQALVVRALNNGLPVVGVTVNWAASNGAVVFNAGPTDINGLTSVQVQVTAAGPVVVDAARADFPLITVQFLANGAASLASLPGLTPEETETAGALDAMCQALLAIPVASRTPVQTDALARCSELTLIAPVNPAAAIAGIRELLPDSQAAAARAAFLSASTQFENIKVRIAALRSGTQGNSWEGLAFRQDGSSGGQVSLANLFRAFAGESSPEVGADFDRWGFFASGSLSRGDVDSRSFTPSYDFDIQGLTLGVDYRKSDKLVFGAALGYTDQDTDLDGSEGQANTRSMSLSLFGTYYQSDSWFVDGVLSYGRNDYETLRRILYTLPSGTIDQLARSDSEGSTVSAGFTYGYDLQKGAWGFGPYARMLFTRVDFDASQEVLEDGTPGSSLGLIIDPRRFDSFNGVIGGKLTYTHSASWGVLIPHFQFEWEHEFESSLDDLSARFINDPSGTPIVIEEEGYDGDFFRLGLGLSMIFSQGRSGFFYYERYLARDGVSQDHLALGLRLEF